MYYLEFQLKEQVEVQSKVTKHNGKGCCTMVLPSRIQAGTGGLAAAVFCFIYNQKPKSVCKNTVDYVDMCTARQGESFGMDQHTSNMEGTLFSFYHYLATQQECAPMTFLQRMPICLRKMQWKWRTSTIILEGESQAPGPGR